MPADDALTRFEPRVGSYGSVFGTDASLSLRATPALPDPASSRPLKEAVGLAEERVARSKRLARSQSFTRNVTEARGSQRKRASATKRGLTADSLRKLSRFAPSTLALGA